MFLFFYFIYIFFLYKGALFYFYGSHFLYHLRRSVGRKKNFLTKKFMLLVYKWLNKAGQVHSVLLFYWAWKYSYSFIKTEFLTNFWIYTENRKISGLFSKVMLANFSPFNFFGLKSFSRVGGKKKVFFSWLGALNRVGRKWEPKK